MQSTDLPLRPRPRWLRAVWLLAGGCSLLAGIVGIFLPLLPTTPFVLLAAFCFSRGSQRCETWLLQHPRFGPMVRGWRANRAVPLRAKQLSSLMMVLGCSWAWWTLPPHVGWLPVLLCSAVALWLWSLPTAARRAEPPSAQG